MPLSSTEFASGIKLIKCVKAQSSDNIPPVIYSEVLRPQMSNTASKILYSLRDLPNNRHNTATGHSYLGNKTGKVGDD